MNAEEATSARAIGGGGGCGGGFLGREEAAAWELFSPVQRVLLVAVIGVAVAESRKNRLIAQLRSSVELRVCDLLRNLLEIIILFGISYVVD